MTNKHITLHTATQTYCLPAEDVEINSEYKTLTLKTINDREGYPVLIPFQSVMHIDYYWN